MRVKDKDNEKQNYGLKSNLATQPRLRRQVRGEKITGQRIDRQETQTKTPYRDEGQTVLVPSSDDTALSRDGL